MKKKKFTNLLKILLVFLLLLNFTACESSTSNQTISKQLDSEKSTKTLNQDSKDTFQPGNEDSNQSTEQETSQQKEEAIVSRVVDGDTIVVILNGREEKVRLIGIDTPERGRPYFNEAKQKTAELVLGKKVRMEKDVSERDRYGRLLRYVYVGNIFVNAELVKQGYAMAYTYPPDVKYSELFVRLQQEARSAGRGLWQTTSDSGNSKVQNTGSSEVYVASKNSDVFHYPDCNWAKRISPNNLIKFNSREAALNSGRRPCKVCNP
ncbi:MAG: thermonuclease family protein [Actinobacteria bacterium]|nr:thermonuclease family protein [Actinomycetota bacterium]